MAGATRSPDEGRPRAAGVTAAQPGRIASAAPWTIVRRPIRPDYCARDDTQPAPGHPAAAGARHPIGPKGAPRTMALFGKKAKRERRLAKAEEKAITRKAELEAKLTARNDRKYRRRALRSQRRLEDAQLKVEQAQLRTLAAQEKAANRKLLTVSNVRRYVAVAQIAVPVLAPIVYQAVTALRAQLDQRRAAKLGVSVQELAQFSGHGAGLSARIAHAETSLGRVRELQPQDRETKEFAAEVGDRLGKLATAVSAAEPMPAARRRAAHSSIDLELAGIEADLLARLGVR